MRLWFMVRKLRAVFVFYKHNNIIPWLLTVLCCVLYAWTGDATSQFITKVLTDALYLYFLFLAGNPHLFYYYNMGIGRCRLICSWFITDLLLFSIGIYFTHLMMLLWK